MSHRRKHVTSNAKDLCPEIKEKQKILRVAGVRGSNLVEARYCFFFCPIFWPRLRIRA